MIRSRLAWPFLTIMALLVVLPLGVAGCLAFTDYTGIRAPTFTGLDNVDRLRADDAFWRTIMLSAGLAAVVPAGASVGAGAEPPASTVAVA